jgi:hypothetical protein
MLSNGNYAQYFPQTLTPQFMGAFGAGPQFGQQGAFGMPGAYGGYPGFGSDTISQGFGQQLPFSPALGASGGNLGVSHQIALALGQLAQHVATQGVLAQQIGGSLSQLAQQLIQQVAQQGRQVPFANVYGGFAGNSPLNSPFVGFGNPPGFANQTFAAAPGQVPFSQGTSAGFGAVTPQAQAWASNRPAMAS